MTKERRNYWICSPLWGPKFPTSPRPTLRMPKALQVLLKSRSTRQYVRRRIRNFSIYPWRGFLPLWKGSRIPILSSWGLSIRSAIPCRTLEYEWGDRKERWGQTGRANKQVLNHDIGNFYQTDSKLRDLEGIRIKVFAGEDWGNHGSITSDLIFKSRSYERLGLDLFTAILAQFCRSIPEFNPNLISERLDLTRRTLSKGISTSLWNVVCTFLLRDGCFQMKIAKR